MMNSFGQGCINEYIRYDRNQISFAAQRNYEFLLKKCSKNYYATIEKGFLKEKIADLMKKSIYLIGFGIKEDVSCMKSELDIDLNAFNLADLQKHPGFLKAEKPLNKNYTETLKTLSQIYLKRMIQKEGTLHDSF